MREGLSQTATVVRWLSIAWPVGVAIYAVFGDAEYSTPGMLVIVAWAVVPAAGAFAAAWLLDVYAKTCRPSK
jgi:hypothetical protein